MRLLIKKNWIGMVILVACFGLILPVMARAEVVINEIYPNPSGIGEDTYEWVELKNTGSEEIDINGWRLADKAAENSTSNYLIKNSNFNTILPPNGFLIMTFTNKLNNSDETVFLFNNEKVKLQEVSYGTSKKTEALARDSDGSYKWTTTPTQSAENIITSPVEEAEEPQETVEATEETNSEDPASSSQTSSQVKTKPKYVDQIYITEIWPDEIGIDKNEWVEIYNNSNESVSLDEWILKDNADEYKFDNLFLTGWQYLIIKLNDKGIQLNNIGGEKLQLLDKRDNVISEVEYEETKEGKSYNNCEEGWIWLEATPGEKDNCPEPNKLPLAYFEVENGEIKIGDYVTFDGRESYDPDGEIEYYNWEFEKKVMVLGEEGYDLRFKNPELNAKLLEAGSQNIKLTVTDNLKGENEYEINVEVVQDEHIVGSVEKIMPASKSIVESFNYENNIGPMAIGDAKNLTLGSYINVQGIVVVEPGVIGKTMFYIVDAEGEGIQIYSYNKDFPGLVVGDEIAVMGQLTESQGEKRIKIQTKMDIIVIGETELPAPILIQAEDLDEDYEGDWVFLEGDITEIKSSSIWVDDQTGEVRVYLKINSGLITENLAVGDKVKVQGVVTEVNGEYRLVPRYPGDIQVVGQVLGAEDKKDNIENNSKDANKTNVLRYFLALAIAIIIILIVYIIKGKTHKISSQNN